MGTEFKNNIGLVHTQAKKCFGWASAVGVPMDYDDAFQEASIAFLQAQRGYDPETGNKFSTYYTMAAFSQFRKSIGVLSGVKNLNPAQRVSIQKIKDENERRKACGSKPLPEQFYGLNPTNFSALGTEEDEAFENTIASGGDQPLDILLAKETLTQCESAMSPLASLMMEWLCSPPPALLRELKAQGAHNEYRVDIGDADMARHPEVTLATIGKFIRMTADVGRGELEAAGREIAKVCALLETGGV